MSHRMTFTIPTVLEELQHIKSVMWPRQYKIFVIIIFFLFTAVFVVLNLRSTLIRIIV